MSVKKKNISASHTMELPRQIVVVEKNIDHVGEFLKSLSKPKKVSIISGKNVKKIVGEKIDNSLKKYGFTRRYDSCNYKCRGILTVKNRYGQGSLYEPLGLLNGDYPYFRENGKIIQCHRRVIELVLGRKLTKDEHIHHIDMNKLNYNYDNLWLTTNKYHKIAHNSYNESCEELIKRGIMAFNEEKGRYYLINKET